MGLNLTQLASDNFNRANVNPLAAPWALDEAGEPGLQIVSDVCVTASSDTGQGRQFYEYAGMPNDQFVSATTVNSIVGEESLQMYVRATDNGQPAGEFPAYRLAIGPNTFQVYSDNGSGFILSGGLINTTTNPGDVFTLAIVGSTLYVFQNGTQIGSVTNTEHASGITGLIITPEVGFAPSVSLFAMGSAALSATYSISGNCGDAGATVSYSGTSSGSVNADGSGNYTIPNLANGNYTITPSSPGRVFSPASQAVTVSGANLTGVNFTDGIIALAYLGSVVEVSSPDAGKSNPFLGTFKIVSAAPGGQAVGQSGNPYLGHIKVVANPPAGYNGANPVLGEVVVIGSAPAGALDPWLGSAETD